jgi:hypothetical protein
VTRHTRILRQAVRWATREELKGIVTRLRARGKDLDGLDEAELARAHPARVHAVLAPERRGVRLREIRVWDSEAGRAWGFWLELRASDLQALARAPDPVYHEMIAHLRPGWFT